MALMTTVGLEFIARDRSRSGMSRFGRSVSNVRTRIRGLTSSVLMLAGVGGGLYMLQRAMRGVIKTASAGQEIQSKFDVVFGENARAANLWSESFAKSVGRARQDVKSWMATLQDTFVPLGFARDKALELAQSLTKLAVDVGSFNDVADAEVIRGFTSALVGNHEAVRRYGIIITESTLKQEALNSGLNKTFKELTDLDKVQLRYNILLRGTRDAQGDALRTAGSYANRVKRLQATIKNLSETIGTKLLPAITELVKQLTELIEGPVGKGVQKYFEGLATVLGGINFRKTIKSAREEYRKLTGDMRAFQKQGMMTLSGQTQYFDPKYPKTFDLIKRQMLAGETVLAPPMTGLYQQQINAKLDADKKMIETTVNRVTEEAQVQKKATFDIAAAYDRMFGQMRRMTMANYRFRVKILDELKKKYIENGMDRLMVEQWYTEQVDKLSVERLRSSQNMLDGLRAAGKQAKLEMKTIGDIGYEAAMKFKKGFGDAFADAMMKTRSLAEAMDSLAASIQRAVLASIGENIAGYIIGGLFPSKEVPAKVAHGGGVVERISATRSVPAALFAGAQRLHSGRLPGLLAGEEPVILNRKETVIPEGMDLQQGGGTVNIYVSAIGPRDTYEFLRSNKRQISNMLYGDMQKNPALRRFER